MSSLLAETASGATFGAALFVSGVYAPEIIKAQMLFTHSHMLQVFLGGSASSAIVLHLADRAGYLHKKHRPPSNVGVFPYDGNIVGGALIGLGMSLTGACPGTAMVQLGAGMINGLLVVVGGIMGAAMFLAVQSRVQGNRAVASNTPTASPTETRLPTTSPKALDIPTALSVQPLTMLLLWIPMCIAIIVAAYILNPSRVLFLPFRLLPPAFGGLLIGLAQAATVLLARHHLGASASYEDMARWLMNRLSRHRAADGSSPALGTPSVAFGVGIVCSAAFLRYGLLGAQEHLSIEETPRTSLGILGTAAGGASMVFGARLAGGCTSGHGISGLSKFSSASLATTCAIFAGGILSALLLLS